jgi:L-lactate dehydrogenase complex protein LldG
MESRGVILETLRKTRRTTQAGGEGQRYPVYAPDEVFADIPEAEPGALIDQFTRKLTALRGEVHHVPSLEGAAQKIGSLAKETGLKRCGRQRHPLLDRLFTLTEEVCALESQMTIVEPNKTPLHSAIEGMECSFTVADALIARTGSIVLRATTAGGRRLSVLPPMHCVVATRDQLIPCLSSWLRSAHKERDWSYGTIITGPSRTADIERILVLGAHGPKRLIVIVVDRLHE